MVIVGNTGVSIPYVEARNETDGKGNPEAAIRAGNSCANCVAIGDIPACLMRFHPVKFYF